MIVNPGLRRFNNRGRSLFLPGTSGNYASTPDAAQLDVSGDISFIALASLTDWTPAAQNNVLAKSVATGNQRSFTFAIVITTGVLRIVNSADGIAQISADSTVAPTVTDGAYLWIGGQLDVDNGAGGKTAKFYTSTNGVSWTQLGADVTSAGTTSIFNSTSPLEIGSNNLGTNAPFSGLVSRAMVFSGLYFTGASTLVADFNPRATTRGHTTFTDSVGLPWTINGTAAIV